MPSAVKVKGSLLITKRGRRHDIISSLNHNIEKYLASRGLTMLVQKIIFFEWLAKSSDLIAEK